MIRKCCMSCLLVSNEHTDACKRCGYEQFSTIDDYVDQDSLNERNKDIVCELESTIATIKYETKLFDNLWYGLWDSNKDMDFNLTPLDDQKDFTPLLSDLNNL